MEIIKAGTTPFYMEDVKKIYNEKKYVCNYSGIFQPCISSDGKQVYFRKIINIRGYAQKGRFYIQDAKTINNVLGENIINE